MRKTRKLIPLILIGIFISTLVLFIPNVPIARANVVLVQGPYNQDCGTPVATCAQIYTSPVTAGDLAVITFFIHNTAAPTVTDTDGATFTISCASLNIWQNCTAYTTVLNNHGGSAYTVTVHNGGSNTEMEIVAAETSGGSVSCQVTGTGTGTTATTSSSCSFSGTWFIMASASDNNAAGISIGAGFTVCSSGWIIGTKCQYDTTSVTSPTSFPFTWSGSSGWQDAGIAITVSTVTLPINITTLLFGTATINISGCGVSNSTFNADGFKHTYSSLTHSCAVTLSTNTVGNTRYAFSGSPHPTAITTFNFNTCASGTCSTYTNNTYYQLQNQYGVKPNIPSTWDSSYSFSVIGSTVGGTGILLQTISVIAGSSQISFQSWADYNKQVQITPNTFFNSMVTGYWLALGNNTWIDTTGGNLHIAPYNRYNGQTQTITQYVTSNVVTTITPQSNIPNNSAQALDNQFGAVVSYLIPSLILIGTFIYMTIKSGVTNGKIVGFVAICGTVLVGFIGWLPWYIPIIAAVVGLGGMVVSTDEKV